MSLSPAGRIRFLVTGARGANFADIARQSGAYGVQRDDTDAQVSEKFAAYAIAVNPDFQGPQGDPGSSPYANVRDYAEGSGPDSNGSINGSVNSEALQSAVDADAKRISLASGTGGKQFWRFDSQLPVVAMGSQGITIESDDAAILSTPDDAILTPLGGLVKHANPTHYLFRNLSTPYIARPDGNLPVDQKSIFLGNKGPDYSHQFPVLANDVKSLKPSRIAFSANNSWEAEESGKFAAPDASRYVLQPGSNDGRQHIAFKSLIPKQRYTAAPVVASGSPRLTAIIRHTNGYVGISCESGSSPQLYAISRNGSEAEVSNVFNFFSSTHSSYSPSKSVWSIHIDSWKKCSILFNGFVVVDFPTSGFIYDAGFGMSPTGDTDQVQWRDLVIGTDMEPSSGRFISVAIFGDSRSQERDSAPAHFLRNALDLSFGVRCARLDNFAMGGQSSGQQRTILEGTDLSPYNHIHINIGTNDVQGNVSLDTFKANVTAMANASKVGGRIVSFGIFPVWYTQAQSGGRGQASARYDESAAYRSFLMRFCADNGYPIVDLSLWTGPILAQYVNSTLQPNLTAQGDPIVFDNIHFTSIFNRIIGEQLARMILGTIFPKPTLYLGPQELTGKNGWTGGGETPVWEISSDGTIKYSGFFTAGTLLDGTVIATVPAIILPKSTIRRILISNSGISKTVNLDANTGDISIYGYAGSSFIDIGQLGGYSLASILS